MQGFRFNRPLPARPGCYIVVLEVSGEVPVEAKTIKVTVTRGVYVYIGSGGGPGGLRARILRHLKRRKRIWWHIDRLTASSSVRVVGAVYCEAPECRSAGEASIAECLSGKGYIPVRRFGSTDDPRSESHLYRAPSSLGLEDVLCDALHCIKSSTGSHKCGRVVLA